MISQTPIPVMDYTSPSRSRSPSALKRGLPAQIHPDSNHAFCEAVQRYFSDYHRLHMSSFLYITIIAYPSAFVKFLLQSGGRGAPAGEHADEVNAAVRGGSRSRVLWPLCWRRKSRIIPAPPFVSGSSNIHRRRVCNTSPKRPKGAHIT